MTNPFSGKCDRLNYVQVHEGVSLSFYPSDTRPIHVELGVTSAQDLTCDLGAPIRVYHKDDDRMAIHSQNKAPYTLEEGCKR